MDLTVPPALANQLVAPAQPQLPFAWKRQAWRSMLHDVPGAAELLDALPEKVDRTSTLEVVNRGITEGEILPAFIAAMIWGHGTTGFGPVRVRRSLTGLKSGTRDAPIRVDVEGLLRISALKVRNDGPLEGFRYMNNEGKIKHLGSAFFTKWLYFASAGENPDAPNASPILDRQVRDWIRNETGLSLGNRRTEDYAMYIETLTVWGIAYDRSPVQVEKEIFALATGRG
ncbi:hypothetical protein JVX90_19860 [Gordonia sp. PDNC005]|uniref:8-oxoguanine DNA glycosylase OGG fold protein n=1 Tax=Gordonia sp. PDNC005 TaxID=2811424 RepID=UPI001962A5EA|nr:hypothetical protein [Gordonia sp. PDNC005]QRY62585.1 hypothetical protein JVX90_19860 [Gordonia sp. PDNC005]